MNYRFIRLSSLIVLLALVLGSAFSVRAQQPATSSDAALQQIQSSGRTPLSDVSVGESAEIDSEFPTNAQGRATIVVELADEPATVTYARAVAEKSSQAQTVQKVQSQLATIEQAQLQVVNQLSALNADVLYRNQRVYNGIAIEVDADQIARIRAIDGVINILPLTEKTIDNASGVQLIGAPQVWTGVNGVTGAGLRVGIIDTGIDYTHANFGGGGIADYTNNDTTIITDTLNVPFPTAKVVGGYDFAGDAYNPSASNPANRIPKPDFDPLDCNGHGSHVAGTTGGYGVNANGTTYAGPYNSSINFGAMRIGPGVAPGSKLYALKVFGCAGSTNVTDRAIEWAVDPNNDGNFADHLDVINLSLGSAFGSQADTSAVASNNAALAGVIVVASAGNSGDTYYITGSPGAAQRVMSVASSVDAESILDAFRVNPPSSLAGVYPALNSANYLPWTNTSASLPLTGTLYYPATNRNACVAFSPAEAANIAGKIVLIDWSEPSCATSGVRAANVTAAGGIGVLMADDSEVFDLSIAGSSTVPAQSIPLDVGAALKTALANGEAISITFDRRYNGTIKDIQPDTVDLLSAFSSRGPRRGDNGFKPDISAPGQSIYSTAYGTGNLGASFNGTSMAAPHMAGVAALLRELHPTWTVEEIKALAVNTAIHDIRSARSLASPIYGPTRGPGRVDVPRAAASNVVMYATDDDGAVNLSFGAVEVVGTATITKTVTVVNKGGTAVSYNAAYAPVTNIPGVSYSVAPSVVNVPANGTATLSVVLTANAAAMKKTRDVTVAPTQTLARDWLSEASGHLTLTGSGASTMFKAMINGTNEVPPVTSAVNAMAAIDYNPATNAFSYTIKFTGAITPTMAHLHSAPAGIGGGVVVGLPVSGQYNANNAMSGQVTLTDAAEALLNKGGLYINIHTAANPGGELRGQVNSARPNLRLGVYATARPASAMGVNQGLLPLKSDVSNTTGLTLTLGGTGVNNGLGGNGITSLVSFYDLHHVSPNEPTSTGLVNSADLKYVGITSDFAATNSITNTGIYIGIATHGNWSVPSASDTEFDVYFDTNRDGTDDYILFNYNLSQITGGRDASDVFVTVLRKLTSSTRTAQRYINDLSPAVADTSPYNSNVIMLPVDAKNLNLNLNNPTFDYNIVTYSREGGNVIIDSTPTLTFNPTKPSFVVPNAQPGGSLYFDLPGSLGFNYDPTGRESLGILALHHHNASGNRDEVLYFTEQVTYLPLIRR